MTAILLILLSHHGYWFGGQYQTISVRWAIEQKMPAADLQWQLLFGPSRLAGGQSPMPGDGDAAVVKLKLPVVRARTQMQWVFKLVAHDGGRELASGQNAVWVFPPTPWPDIASGFAGMNVFVVDAPGGLSELLSSAKIKAASVSVGDLQTVRADIILVGAGQLEASAFAQAPLMAHARAGAQVLILRQKQVASLGGYPVTERPLNANLSWRETHPLLAGLGADDLKSWLDEPAANAWAIRLPADEPALEIGFWSRETPGKQPVPIDALLVVKAVGKGRMIFSQIPLGDYDDDPRTQMFLFNALNYLQTRPEPTPPPSRRIMSEPPTPATVPTITIPSGATP